MSLKPFRLPSSPYSWTSALMAGFSQMGAQAGLPLAT